MVFFNSPYRETSKNVLKKKSRKKCSDGGWVGLGLSKCTGGGVRRFFFRGPSGRYQHSTRHFARRLRGVGVGKNSRCRHWPLALAHHPPPAARPTELIYRRQQRPRGTPMTSPMNRALSLHRLLPPPILGRGGKRRPKRTIPSARSTTIPIW
jgi:hypothetical protein